MINIQKKEGKDKVQQRPKIYQKNQIEIIHSTIVQDKIQ